MQNSMNAVNLETDIFVSEGRNKINLISCISTLESVVYKVTERNGHIWHNDT